MPASLVTIALVALLSGSEAPPPPQAPAVAPAPRGSWSTAQLLETEPPVNGHRIDAEWRRSGKRHHQQADASAPHAVVFGNLGELRGQTGADIPYVDGARTFKGLKHQRVLRLAPGEHELVVLVRFGASFASPDVLVTPLTVEAGKAYRISALLGKGVLKKQVAIAVEITDDLSLVPAER